MTALVLIDNYTINRQVASLTAIMLASNEEKKYEAPAGVVDSETATTVSPVFANERGYHEKDSGYDDDRLVISAIGKYMLIGIGVVKTKATAKRLN